MDIVETSELVYSATEIEVLAIADVLREAGIENKTSIHRDTAYPGIVDGLQPPAEIRVAPNQATDARALIEAFLATEPMPTEDLAQAPDRSVGAVDGWSYGWIITSLIFVGVLAAIAFLTQ